MIEKVSYRTCVNIKCGIYVLFLDIYKNATCPYCQCGGAKLVYTPGK